MTLSISSQTMSRRRIRSHRSLENFLNPFKNGLLLMIAGLRSDFRYLEAKLPAAFPLYLAARSPIAIPP